MIGSGSNSLNSRKLPGRFSYGLGTRLATVAWLSMGYYYAGM